ncbi:hypothetical protein Taro_027184, partial [Colocasia esculenta]|nr:hypothetical protein [Colocasia esculenta]
MVWTAVALRFVTRHPAPSRSGGFPFPLSSPSPSLPPLRGGKPSSFSFSDVWSSVVAGGSCAERERRRGGGGRGFEKAHLVWATSGCSIPAVYLPADVATAFLLLWLVRDWLSLLSLVHEAHHPYSLQVASFPAGSRCELQESICCCCWVRVLRAWLLFSLVLRLGSSSACASVWVCREDDCRVGHPQRITQSGRVSGQSSQKPDEKPGSRVLHFVCPCGRVVCFASCALCALPDGRLVSAVGVRLVVLYHGFWCHVAHRGDLRGEGPFLLSYLEVELVALLVCILCLEVLVVVWCVALSTYVVGAVPCVVSRGESFLLAFVVSIAGALVHCVVPWVAPGAGVGTVCRVVCLIVSFVRHFPSLLGVRGVELSASRTLCDGLCLVVVLLPLWGGCFALSSRRVFSSDHEDDLGEIEWCRWTLSCVPCRGFRLAASLFLAGLVRTAPVELLTSARVLYAVVVRLGDMSGCRGIPEGRILVVVWAAVALRAHRDIIGGVTRVERDLIAAQSAVAIRIVSRPGGRTCGETFLLTWLFGVSRADTWLFLPDLVELLCLGGCVPRCCFRIVFHSAGSAGVVFGLTLVVGHVITLFRCFVLLYRALFARLTRLLSSGRDSLSQEFVAGRS